jgi:hypothetical protein
MATKNKITLFNPEPTPVVYDEAGRSLGSVERVTLDELDAVGRCAVDAGLLVQEEPEASKSSSGSKSASASKATDGGADKSADKETGSGVSTRARAD